MKLKGLLIAYIACMGLYSCQSEYGERMTEAKKLKVEYQKVRNDMYDSKNPVLKIQLGKIEKKIKFHATLSGNERLFLKEVWDKR